MVSHRLVLDENQESLCSSPFENLRQAILTEMSHDKPRVDVLKQLMSTTFNLRQSTITETTISESVKLYPSLKLPNIVSNTCTFLII